MTSLPYRSSGYDFSDGQRRKVEPYPFPSEKSDDVVVATGASRLQRNRTERGRLQGLMRTESRTQTAAVGPTNVKLLKLRERWDHWMVNDGGRQLFFGVWVLIHLLAVTFGFLNYQLKDNLTTARATFGYGYPIARSAALTLHFDVALILLPVCRNFISWLRQTPLNDFIPFDKNLSLHKATGWSIVFFTVVHIVAHMFNFARLATVTGTDTGSRLKIFFLTNFTTGPGATGWVMTLILGIMVWYAMEKRKRQNFERFWYSHHLFIVFFMLWQMHGMFCMIKPDAGSGPQCSWNTIGVFWRYWLFGGCIWIYERILREVRSRHRTYINKVIQHPSKVMEIQIKKEHCKTRAGQYIFLSCPEISYFQWHPFTLTSAPEEDYISVHIRVVGDFTAALAKALGCNFDEKPKKGEKGADGGPKIIDTAANPPLNKVLPRVMVDGPFGSASEDFLNYETILLVGAGIGVTPFASILKSIWYRMNHFNANSPTRLSKVYFVWVIRDFGTAEWFHSLLHAIEEQDVDQRIEISIHLTAKLKEDEMNNILVQDVGADRDAITSLRAPTHFGRPNWDRVFTGIAEKHMDTDVGVFFCGPAVLSKQLKVMSNKYTSPKGTKFHFGKGMCLQFIHVAKQLIFLPFSPLPQRTSDLCLYVIGFHLCSSVFVGVVVLRCHRL
ncbi:hypothetical protein FRB93_008023 [Tulasnella sp. JGI-2019a]|nr:hypothetical protein FRB93_008023 [Tulasnella sp. JGI-2019a]